MLFDLNFIQVDRALASQNEEKVQQQLRALRVQMNELERFLEQLKIPSDPAAADAVLLNRSVKVRIQSVHLGLVALPSLHSHSPNRNEGLQSSNDKNEC